jgi:hypothetical protein
MLRKLKNLKKKITLRYRSSMGSSKQEDPDQPGNLPKEKRD